MEDGRAGNRSHTGGETSRTGDALLALYDEFSDEVRNIGTGQVLEREQVPASQEKTAAGD